MAGKSGSGDLSDAFRQDEQNMQRLVDMTTGASGGFLPLDASPERRAAWEIGRGIYDDNQRQETNGGARTSDGPSRTYPVQSLTKEEQAFWYKDGLYGIPLDPNLFTAAYWNGQNKREAVQAGRQDFIEGLADNPHFRKTGMLISADRYVDMTEYQPYAGFRTFNPLVAIKYGFDGGTVTDKMSSGAVWCVERGQNFGKMYRDYKVLLDEYEAAETERNKRNILVRGWLKVMEPLSSPYQGEDIRHVLEFLRMYEHFAQPNNDVGQAGWALK